MNTCDFLTKYRPTELDKTLFTSDLILKVNAILADSNISVIAITGVSGSGKTTLARICTEIVKAKRNIKECSIKEYSGLCPYTEDTFDDTGILILDDFESTPLRVQSKIITAITKQSADKFVIFVTETVDNLVDEVQQLCQKVISTELDFTASYSFFKSICDREGITHSTGVADLNKVIRKNSNIRYALSCLEYCKCNGRSLEDTIVDFFKEEYNG